MGVLITFVVILAVLSGLGTVGFLWYRRGLRYAKGVERGIKMVPIHINLPPASEDAEVGGRDVRDVVQERISQAEVLYNLIASTATKGFKSKFFGQRHIAFELVAVGGIIHFYAAVPVAMVSVIKQAILTAYPGAQLEEAEDHNIFNESGKIAGTYGGEITLKKDYAYPIATFKDLQRDAMTGLINGLKALEEGDGASVQILLRPAREGWDKHCESVAKDLGEDDDDNGFSFKHVLQAPFKVPEGGGDEGGGKPPKSLSGTEQKTIEAIENKAKATGYEVLIRVVASSNTASRAQANTNNIVAAFSLFDSPGMNGFKFTPAKNIEEFVTDFIFRFFPPEKKKTILNSVELSTLFHFPDEQFSKSAQVQRQQFKQVEGPTSVSETGVLLGENIHHGVKKEIRLSDGDRNRHVYVVGQTGTGKSTLLENMIVQDMQAGKGFAFIDPHGDAAEDILGKIPKERSEDVIYFDPGDMDSPPGLNIFEYHTEDQKDFLIQEAINMLEKLYDPHNQGIVGPRYHHMFRNAALTVMADPAGGTFIDISKLFRDQQFVKDKLKYVEDKTVLEFWQKEMPAAQRSSDHGEIVSWFVSKFGAFLSNQMMRNIIGQSQSAFDLRDVMDNRKILIANLSKGRLGELNSNLLGMIFVMKFQAAAMSRANIPESQRVDFSLYVDEFQNFSTESFANILSEARKYKLNLVVANQYISQLSEEVREAVFGNVGTIVSFRCGPNDADFLVKQFSPAFNERDLVEMPNRNTVMRLMNNGLPSKPFNMATLPPIGTSSQKLADALKQLSSLKYGRPRQEVEDEIFERLSVKPPPSPFDSLASREQEGEGAPSSGRPRPDDSEGQRSGGSSFLDEWLAKRRQAMQQPGGSAAGQQPPSRKQSQSGEPAPGSVSEQNIDRAPQPSPPTGAAVSSERNNISSQQGAHYSMTSNQNQSQPQHGNNQYPQVGNAPQQPSPQQPGSHGGNNQQPSGPAGYGVDQAQPVSQPPQQPSPQQPSPQQPPAQSPQQPSPQQPSPQQPSPQQPSPQQPLSPKQPHQQPQQPSTQSPGQPMPQPPGPPSSGVQPDQPQPSGSNQHLQASAPSQPIPQPPVSSQDTGQQPSSPAQFQTSESQAVHQPHPSQGQPASGGSQQWPGQVSGEDSASPHPEHAQLAQQSQAPEPDDDLQDAMYQSSDDQPTLQRDFGRGKQITPPPPKQPPSLNPEDEPVDDMAGADFIAPPHQAVQPSGSTVMPESADVNDEEPQSQSAATSQDDIEQADDSAIQTQGHAEQSPQDGNNPSHPTPEEDHQPQPAEDSAAIEPGGRTRQHGDGSDASDGAATPDNQSQSAPESTDSASESGVTAHNNPAEEPHSGAVSRQEARTDATEDDEPDSQTSSNRQDSDFGGKDGSGASQAGQDEPEVGGTEDTDGSESSTSADDSSQPQSGTEVSDRAESDEQVSSVDSQADEEIGGDEPDTEAVDKKSGTQDRATTDKDSTDVEDEPGQDDGQEDQAEPPDTDQPQSEDETTQEVSKDNETSEQTVADSADTSSGDEQSGATDEISEAPAQPESTGSDEEESDTPQLDTEALKDELSQDLGTSVSLNTDAVGTNAVDQDEGEAETAASDGAVVQGQQPAQDTQQAPEESSTRKRDPNVPELSPGEVYIDEDGVVHQG